MIHKIAARLPRKPAAYLCLFLIWYGTLWFLSGGNHAPKDSFGIPHIDKLYHFVYFLAGGVLFALFGGLKWQNLSNRQVFFISLVICSIVGGLDEYRQGFTPGRSGNDPGDWLADTLGGAAGALFVIWLILPHMIQHPLNHPKAAKK